MIFSSIFAIVRKNIYFYMTEQPVKKYDFDRVTRLVISLVCIVGGVLLLRYLSGVLLPFLVGCLIAYMLDPLVKWIMRLMRTNRRLIPSVIAVIVTFGAIIGIIWLIVPYLVNEVSQMVQMLTTYAKSTLDTPYIPSIIEDFIKKYIDLNFLTSLVSGEQVMKLFTQVAHGTWSIVGGTMSIVLTVVSWVIVLLYMFFVLIDYDKVVHGFKAMIPLRYRRMALRVIGDVENTMSRYFRGQALVSLFVGIIFAIEFYIIGLPLAIVFGLSIGILNMVPYLQLVSIPFAAFLCLVASVATGGSFWVLFGWTILAYCICQVIQDLVLIPAIMKQQMGLNPAIIFLSLSIWAYLLGFIGLIIALPLTTLIISYYNEFVLKK